MMKLPKRTDAQKLGVSAADVLSAVLTNFCNVIPVHQERDFGIDFICEIFQDGHPTGKWFNVQSKGAEEVKIKSNTIKINIKVRTLNYWLLQENPTFIIVVNRQDNTFYWSFPEEFLQSRSNKDCQNQEEVTILIPTNNCFQLNSKELPYELISRINLPRKRQYGHDKYFWWIPYEIGWHHDITLVVLPVCPENGKALCMSKHPITNSQYKGFVDDQWVKEPVGARYLGKEILGQHWVSPFYPWRTDNFRDPNKPVVCVSYWNASLFCDWLHEKYGCYVKLPTSKLWDFAAFGTEFPAYDPNIFLNMTKKVHHQSSSPAVIDLIGERTNKWGIADLLGNVWEWCALDSEGFVGESESHHIVRHRYEGFYDRNLNLKGGGFLDNLESTKLWMQSTELAHGSRTCHSDIGFRVTTEVLVSSLPTNIQEKLQVFKRLMPRTQSYSNPKLYPSDFKYKDFPSW